MFLGFYLIKEIEMRIVAREKALKIIQSHAAWSGGSDLSKGSLLAGNATRMASSIALCDLSWTKRKKIQSIASCIKQWAEDSHPLATDLSDRMVAESLLNNIIENA
jgi:hypothetical protein